MIPKINSAHGSDTRNVLNRAIDLINFHSKTIQEVVAEGQLTEEQYAELIITVNGMIKSGEVEKSDLHPTLISELDGFNYRLNQKADEEEVRKKQETIGLNDFSPEVLAAIEGGGETSFNLLSVPKDKSVTHSKLNDDVINAVFVDLPLTWELGSINVIDGTNASANNRLRTADKVSFIKGDVINTIVSNVEFRVVLYSSTGVFQSMTDYTKSYNFTSNAYVRLIFRYTDDRTVSESDVSSIQNYISAHTCKVSTDKIKDNSITSEKTTFYEELQPKEIYTPYNGYYFELGSLNIFGEEIEESDGQPVTSRARTNYYIYANENILIVNNDPNIKYRIFRYDEDGRFINLGDYTTEDTSIAMGSTIKLLISYTDDRDLTVDDIKVFENNVKIYYDSITTIEEELRKISKNNITTTPIDVPIKLEASGLSKTTGLIFSSTGDYLTTQRTGKFIKVIPNDEIILNFNIGTAFIFEYGSDFSYLGNTNVLSTEKLKLTKDTHLIKILFENVEGDNVDCSITFNYYEQPKFVKNPRKTNGTMSFLYEVNSNVGRDILSTNSTDEQYTTEKYFNSGLLKLPPNYNAHGEPVKLIIFCHGSADYGTFKSQSFGTAYEDYFQYLVDEGYALMDVFPWTTKYPKATGANFGSPTAIAATVQGYKWVVDNYNIDNNGVFVSGKSAGGHIGLNLCYNMGIPVLAAGLLAPAITPFTVPYGYTADTRLAFADDFGFEGNTESILGINSTRLERTQELKDYIISNADKLVGYNPYWNGIVGQGLSLLSQYAADLQETTLTNYLGISRVSGVPQKIWISEDDDAGGENLYDESNIYIRTLKNGQNNAELRLMPNGTGGHHSVDSDPNALKVSSITTKLGITHTDVPLAYVELIQYFRRFEN